MGKNEEVWKVYGAVLVEVESGVGFSKRLGKGEKVGKVDDAIAIDVGLGNGCDWWLCNGNGGDGHLEWVGIGVKCDVARKDAGCVGNKYDIELLRSAWGNGDGQIGCGKGAKISLDACYVKRGIANIMDGDLGGAHFTKGHLAIKKK